MTDIGVKAARSSSVAIILDWALRGLIALAFLAAGAAKLLGAPPMVQLFDQIGIGQWFRFVTAACEIGGACLILLPRTAAFGALLLTCTMSGAVFTHFAIIGGNAAPASILLLLNLVVLWLHRSTLKR